MQIGNNQLSQQHILYPVPSGRMTPPASLYWEDGWPCVGRETKAPGFPFIALVPEHSPRESMQRNRRGGGVISSSTARLWVIYRSLSPCPFVFNLKSIAK